MGITLFVLLKIQPFPKSKSELNKKELNRLFYHLLHDLVYKGNSLIIMMAKKDVIK
jgi:hypothetical protein